MLMPLLGGPLHPIRTKGLMGIGKKFQWFRLVISSYLVQRTMVSKLLQKDLLSGGFHTLWGIVFCTFKFSVPL